MYVSKCVLLVEYVERVSGCVIVVWEGTFVFVESRVISVVRSVRHMPYYSPGMLVCRHLTVKICREWGCVYVVSGACGCCWRCGRLSSG
jgi:hypothetical protein